MSAIDELAAQLSAFLSSGSVYVDDISEEIAQQIVSQAPALPDTITSRKGSKSSGNVRRSVLNTFPNSWTSSRQEVLDAVQRFQELRTQSPQKQKDVPSTQPQAEASQSVPDDRQDLPTPHSQPAESRSASSHSAHSDQHSDDMSAPFTPAQLAAIAQVVREALRESPDSWRASSVPANTTMQAPTTVAVQQGIRPKDIGYFDPDPAKDSVEVKDAYNVYHNVFAFTTRLRVKATDNTSTVVRTIESCLLGAANQWYTMELGNITRAGLRAPTTTIDDWCQMLEARFREAPGRSLRALESTVFTIQDVKDGKDPLAYVSEVVLHGRNSGVVPNQQGQILLAYEHIEGSLRRDLPDPTDMSLESFLASLRRAHNVWKDIYRPSTSTYPRQDRRQRDARPSQSSNFTKSSPHFSRSNENPPQNTHLPNQQYSRQQNQQLLSAKVPLMIDAAPASGRQFTGQSFNRKQQSRRYQKAHVAELDSIDEEQRASSDKNDSSSDADDEHQDDDHQEVVETHFTFPTPAKTQTCRKCSAHFASGNALHRHLKSCKGRIQQQIDATDSHQTPSDRKAPIDRKTPPAVSTVVSSTATDSSAPGYSFRGFKYSTIQVKHSPNGTLHEEILDTGCTMSLAQEAFIRQELPNVEIKVMKAAIPVRGLGSQQHLANKYAVVPFYIPAEDGTSWALISREIHLVEDMSAKVLLGIDFIVPEKISLHPAQAHAVIGSCNNMRITLKSKTKGTRSSQTVLTSEPIVIQPGSHAAIPIKTLSLPNDRDFHFEPQSHEQLDICTHIMDCNAAQILVHNPGKTPVKLQRSAILGHAVEYEAQGCFMVSDDVLPYAFKPASNWKRRLLKSAAMLSAFIATTSATVQGIEETMANGIKLYNRAGEPSFMPIVKQFSELWEDTGNVVGIKDEMEIPLKDNWEQLYRSGHAKVYPAGHRDRKVIDDAFDKLHTQGRMEWTASATPFSFPVFVVWKNDDDGNPKGRAVVDIRALNKIVVPDAYPVPSQDDILAAITGSQFITVVDCSSFFYQWYVKREHQHRLTVISHRGQESFRVPVMGYRNSPAYVQRQIDNILRSARKFARAYMDDIVIFSASRQDHEKHLFEVFTALKIHNITLAPKKTFVGYPTVKLLGQYVDALGLTTADDKLLAISHFKFPKTLGQLEKYLGTTGYLRKYIPMYAAIAEPLQARKTALNKDIKTVGPGRKRTTSATAVVEPSAKELAAFDHLQDLFKRPSVLCHHDRQRQLYIDLDASKEFGIGVMAYHVTAPIDGVPGPKSVQPILFLSRMFTDTEKRYWPTEMEVAALVWTVRKLRHLIEASLQPTIIFTDHSATTAIAKQTSLSTVSTEKLNLRLVRASEYLQRFSLDVRHKSGKSNIVPDALSRLDVTLKAKIRLAERDANEPDSILDVLFVSNTLTMDGVDEVQAFAISLIELSPDFKQEIVDGYAKDKRSMKLKARIEANALLQENAADIPFTIADNLIYYRDTERGMRLYVPQSTEILHKIFHLAHDLQGHPGYDATHERIIQGLYIAKLSSHLKLYIRRCPQCMANATPRHRAYGSLQPILSPARPFHTITIDFILALPESNDHCDCVLSITDKFSKAVSFVPGSTKWNARQWAHALLDRLFTMNWGLPRAIVSDRDRKFLSELWREMFNKMNVKLLYSTAYHPQTDGASERTNATAEIALRYWLMTLKSVDEWPTALAPMQMALNNSTKYSSTVKTPTEILHGFRAREPLDLINETAVRHTTVEAFPAELRAVRKKTTKAMEAIDSSDQEQEQIEPPPSSNRHNRFSTDDDVAQMAEYRPAHVDAQDAIALAVMTMKSQYDSKHEPLFFKVGDWVRLRLHRGYTVPSAKLYSTKLQAQFAGPFLITERVGRLAYRLQLPPAWKVHPVISIAHLEPGTSPSRDPYQRTPIPLPPVEVDGQKENELDKIIAKRKVRKGRGWSTQYLVRWKGYGAEHDEWMTDKKLSNAVDAVQEFEKQYSLRQ